MVDHDVMIGCDLVGQRFVPRDHVVCQFFMIGLNSLRQLLMSRGHIVDRFIEMFDQAIDLRRPKRLLKIKDSCRLLKVGRALDIDTLTLCI